jgi:hypothetical protein
MIAMTDAINTNRLRIFTLLAVFAWLPGCATLDKDECLVADWRLIGYQDGVAGKSSTALGTYREDCAKHAVVPDLDAYQVGRAEGLLEYCEADNGYRLGSSGRGLSSVCPSHLEVDFRAAYDRGREIYLARSAVKTTRSRIYNHQQTLQDLEEEKGYKLAELIADGLKAEQRVLILYEITQLEQEMHSVEDEIAELEYDLSSQQAHLDSLTQHASR